MFTQKASINLAPIVNFFKIQGVEEELLSENLNFRVTPAMRDTLLSNAAMLGSTKDIVLRELVRAFNEYCDGGRRPTFPFTLASPGYLVEAGRVVDATPSVVVGSVPDSGAPKKTGAPPAKGTRSRAG